MKRRRLAALTLVLILAAACAGPQAAQQPTAVATQAPPRSPVPSTATAPPTALPSPTVTLLPPTPAATPPPTSPPAPEPTAVGPAVDEILAGLEGLSVDRFFDESYRQLLRRSPEALTYLGLSESFGLRDDRLNDLSDAYIRDTQRLESGILRLLQGHDRSALAPEQQLSYDVYAWYLDDRVRGHQFMYCNYPVHHFIGSYQDELIRLFTEIQPLRDREDALDYIARLSQVSGQMGQVLDGLSRRQEAGVVPPRFVIEMTLDNLEGTLNSLHPKAGSVSATRLSVYTVFADKVGRIERLTAADKQALLDAALAQVEASFVPAYVALYDLLQKQAAVATDDAGVWKFPGGDACYLHMLRSQTSTDLTPQQVHELGLAEVERIQAEARLVFDQLGYPREATTGELLDRAADEAGYFDTSTSAGADQMVAAYEEILGGMEQRLGEAFDLAPTGRVVVVGDPNGGGYFVPGSIDGSRPGAFHAGVGGWAPKFGMRTTAYHEAIPGHGFQDMITKQLGLPLMRTDLSFNGYVEGWALYTERLAWEMGLFEDDPYGNLGRLRLELLRAVRLVADTGIHAMHWTRQEARDYMKKTLGGGGVEVDRYIVLPAQATSYKIGMLKILELRAEAQERLGDRFDLVEFHRVVLGNGAMPLEILERSVRSFIEAKLRP